jgi:hypothetical protein
VPQIACGTAAVGIVLSACARRSCHHGTSSTSAVFAPPATAAAGAGHSSASLAVTAATCALLNDIIQIGDRSAWPREDHLLQVLVRPLRRYPMESIVCKYSVGRSADLCRIVAEESSRSNNVVLQAIENKEEQIVGSTEPKAVSGPMHKVNVSKCLRSAERQLPD